MTPAHNLELRGTAVCALLQPHRLQGCTRLLTGQLLSKEKDKEFKVILPVDFFLSLWIKATLVINFYCRVVPDQMFGLYFILNVASQSWGAGRREDSVAMPKEDIQLLPALLLKLWEQGKVLLTDLHQQLLLCCSQPPSVCENTGCTNDMEIINWAPSFMLFLV